MPETRTFGRRRTLPQTETHEKPEWAAPSTAPAAAQDGWDTMDQVASASSGDIYLKIAEEPIIVKILDRDPFDCFNAHWIDEITEGSKSIRCWGNSDCPLCQIGDKAKKFSACFNVVTLEDPAHPALRVWEAGIKLARQLKEIALDPKRGPLDRPDLYFSIKKTKKGSKAVEYTLERIKARDLAEEHGIDPVGDDVLAHFTSERFIEAVKEPLDEADMRDIVKKLMDGED